MLLIIWGGYVGVVKVCLLIVVLYEGCFIFIIIGIEYDFDIWCVLYFLFNNIKWIKKVFEK